MNSILSWFAASVLCSQRTDDWLQIHKLRNRSLDRGKCNESVCGGAGSSRYVTALADGVLYLLEDVSQKVAAGAIEAASAGDDIATAFGKKTIVISVDSISKLSTAEHDDFVKVWYSKDGAPKTHTVAMENHGEQLELMREIATSMPDANETEAPIPVIQAIIGPGLTSVGIVAATGVFLALAKEVASGEEIDTSGRRGGMKLLIAKVLGTIGTPGVCANGGLALAGALFWLYNRVQSPPIRTTIERPV